MEQENSLESALKELCDQIWFLIPRRAYDETDCLNENGAKHMIKTDKFGVGKILAV